MGRYYITDSPQALPGSCFHCGSGSRESYIDCGMSVEFVGAIYLCCECVAEMARMYGYMTPEEVKTMVNQVERLKTDVYEYKRQLDGMEMVVNGFTLARGTGGIDSIGSSSLFVPGPDQGSRQGEEDLGAGEGKTPESSDDPRVAKLPDDAIPSNFSLDL